MFRKILFSFALFSASGMSAQAALQSRASGQAYYDTVLNITWLADANLADTNAFGVTGINANGTMIWVTAYDWIAAMNTASYLGISNWRLPTVVDTGTSGCNFAFTGTDCGWNVDLSTGEMAHMFYSTLGNTGARDTAGNPTACSPSSCLTNAGPFSNLQSNGYWYSTPPSPNGWFFAFSGGNQNVNSTDGPFYAWAVSSGDPLATPVPGAVWLFAGALGALGWVKRRSAGERQ